MTSAQTPAPYNHAAALSRVQALLALIVSLLSVDACANALDALFTKAENLLARLMLAAAIRESGRSDLDPNAFDVRISWRANGPCLEIRIKPGLMHPLYRAMIARRRRARLDRRLPRRWRNWSRFTAYTQSRQSRSITVRAHARLSAACITPARTPIPP